METDEQPKKTRKVKKQVRKGDLPIVSGTVSLDDATRNAWIEKENAMVAEDKLVAETDEKKNELESTIYELRDKIETTYAEFASEEEKDKLRAKLTETEVSLIPLFEYMYITNVGKDWLYDEGEDTTKAAYEAKLQDIRAIAGPIIQRYFDKLEAERKAREEEEARKRAEEEAKRKAEEEARKAEEEAKKKAEEEAKKAEGGDTEMKDAPPAEEGQKADQPEQANAEKPAENAANESKENGQ